MSRFKPMPSYAWSSRATSNPLFSDTERSYEEEFLQMFIRLSRLPFIRWNRRFHPWSTFLIPSSVAAAVAFVVIVDVVVVIVVAVAVVAVVVVVIVVVVAVVVVVVAVAVVAVAVVAVDAVAVVAVVVADLQQLGPVSWNRCLGILSETLATNFDRNLFLTLILWTVCYKLVFTSLFKSRLELLVKSNSIH